MSAITAVINQKGGVGKTTTTLCLGASLIKLCYKVLLIDLDSQGNLSSSVQFEQNQEATVFDAMANLANITETISIVSATNEKLHIIKSSPALATADNTFNQTGKEYILKELLDGITADYDYVLLDTPPALGILTINALTAADNIIIPTTADVYSVMGIKALLDTINAVKKYCNRSLTIKGILIIKHNSRTVLNRDLTANLEKQAEVIGSRLFKTRIREGISIREAQASYKLLPDYAPKSNTAIDYAELAKEFVEN